jgi:hypothetical protein
MAIFAVKFGIAVKAVFVFYIVLHSVMDKVSKVHKI